MPLIDDTTVLAEGSTTRRASKTRLTEQANNVCDFGAVGDAVADDTTAIQAAIDWTASDNRGIILFPAGRYKITAPLTFDVDVGHSIIFRGTGAGSRIEGNFAGFLIDRSSAVSSNAAIDLIENLSLINQSTDSASGCIRWNATIGITIRNCFIQGFGGVSSLSSFGFRVENCLIWGLGVHTGSYGVTATLGSAGSISNCDFVSLHDGIQLGAGGLVQNCRFENNGNGINVGTYIDGSIYAASGTTILGCGGERNDCGIWLRNAYYGAIVGCSFHGGGAAPFSRYGGGGTGTGANAWSTYGIRISNACAYNDIQVTTVGDFNEAAVRIDDGQAIGTTLHNCRIENGGTTPGPGPQSVWSIAGTSHSGLKIVSCTPAVDPVMTFADLPATAAAGRAEGVEFNITDCSTSTFLATAAAGGTGATAHRKVRWNGSSSVWQVVG